MKTYVVMLARDRLTGEAHTRIRSDIDKHHSFTRTGDQVTYRKDDGTRIIYTVLYEGDQDVCKKFSETILEAYSMADGLMMGSML